MQHVLPALSHCLSADSDDINNTFPIWVRHIGIQIIIMADGHRKKKKKLYVKNLHYSNSKITGSFPLQNLFPRDIVKSTAFVCTEMADPGVAHADCV